MASIVAAFAASFSGTSYAAVLWYDGFTTTDAGGDYVIGESGTPDLGGQSGGSGSFFSGPWVAAGYPASPPDNTKVFAANLTRPGQINPSIGGSTSNTPHFDCCYESRTSRLFASPWGGFTDPDGTFYASYLVNYGTGNAADPHHRVFEMHEGGFDDGANRNLMLGFSSFAGLGTKLSLAVKDSTTSGTTVVPLIEDADLDDTSVQGVHFMVLKFEMSTSGNDVVSAFLDPVGTTEPAASASVTVGQFLADRMSSLVQFAYTGLGQNGFFDEMRVGTTFADVANNLTAFEGVPEPASLGLLGLGAVCLGLARGKRA